MFLPLSFSIHSLHSLFYHLNLDDENLLKEAIACRDF
jgi:hypothetical protein